MMIEKDHVVRIHYTLLDEAGETLESSLGHEPLALLWGHGDVVPGVEEALAGHATGDRFEVTVPPERGYGPRREDWRQRVSKKHFTNAKRLRPGMQVLLRTRDGARPVTVLKVGGSVVDVDLNHPMAGRTLRFAIEVVEVREAEPEEIAHGHVHAGAQHV